MLKVQEKGSKRETQTHCEFPILLHSSLSCTSLYVSVLLINLCHVRNPGSPAWPHRSLLSTHSWKSWELSDIIYIIKSRATIEGKVYVKVSKVVLINVQSHQAWCIHLKSTTESSPRGAHCVRGKTQHAAGRGLRALQRGCPSSSAPHRARLWAASQGRPTEIVRYLQLAYFHVL